MRRHRGIGEGAPAIHPGSTASARHVALACAALSLAALACTDEPASTTSGGGAGGAVDAGSSSALGPAPVSATASGAGGNSGSSGTGGVNPEDPYGCLVGDMPPRPHAVPEGYLPWSCWSQKRQCMLWIPQDPETMVEPITWEPCAEGSPIVGDGCRQMARTWPFQYYGAIGATFPAVPEMDHSLGAPLIRLVRVSILDATSGYLEWLVGEVDGPVRYALRRPYVEGTQCGFQDYSLNEGFWVLAPNGIDEGPIEESVHDGLMLVDVARQEIRLPYREADSLSTPGWRAGSEWVVRKTGPELILHDHAFTNPIRIHSPADDVLGAGPSNVVQLLGSSAIWEATTSNTVGIRSYHPVAGTRDLVRYPQDPARGAMTPGTDGVDLVWTEGEGREPGDPSYPIRSMMTSPFTTDPAALEPRRLRSDLSKLFGTNFDAFRVGCGFAAKAGANSQKDVQIVRLSDGHGWVLEHTQLQWQSSGVVGLTCDEVFLVVQLWADGVLEGSTIQRIRLDALGEGIPPD